MISNCNSVLVGFVFDGMGVKIRRADFGYKRSLWVPRSSSKQCLLPRSYWGFSWITKSNERFVVGLFEPL